MAADKESKAAKAASQAVSPAEARAKNLGIALGQIEKEYGKGAIMRLGDSAGDTTIEVIPSGCLSLDVALGIGGLPRGRIIEIYGPESSGKTTVALHAIAEAQKAGGIAAFIDAVLSRDTSRIVTGPEISLETHFLVFAAEIARKQKRVLEMKQFLAETGAEKLINHNQAGEHSPA